MLVMMLRTVTVAAPCLWCSSRTTASAVVPCAARCWSSQRQRGRDPGVLVAQPVHELDGECVRQRRAMPIREHHRHRFGGAAARAQQAVGESVRLLPRGAAVHDLLGEAPEIFDQHDPERDRDRPEFADRQRLHLLVGAHEAAQHLGVEVAVGVGDEGPGQAEHPRISRERPVGELRQLPIIAGRQGGADFANLPFDEVVVVDQPFGRRRDGAALVDRSGDRAVGVEQYGSVVGEPVGQRMTPGRLRRDRLRDREASRVLLQAFDAEQLLANGAPLCHGDSDELCRKIRLISDANSTFQRHIERIGSGANESTHLPDAAYMEANRVRSQSGMMA